ncbi:hypothetical protein A3Q56_04543 [Intoshia linei]|uniref:Uncharacterized protein n=1 Tax=Intoshia linei TaxID=1819745 RepID=A0A177B0B4_9BILA|nr:hypothetical protein A3Q56_04543 [Intoshia linei]
MKQNQKKSFLTMDVIKTQKEEYFAFLEDTFYDSTNILSILFSLFALIMKTKLCAWASLYLCFVSFSCRRSSDDVKQVFSSFM